MNRRRVFLNRKGATYIIVVGAAMLIAILMMAGLMLVRIQRSEFQNEADIHQARLFAESALDLGLHHIRENSSTWRNGFDFEATYGSHPEISFRFEDPIDGDISDSYDDPVVILAEGYAGSAMQSIRARLNIDSVGYNALQSDLHSGQNILVNASDVSLREGISYDSSLTLENFSTINSDVTGQNNPVLDKNSEITGSITAPGDTPKNKPSVNGIEPFTHYLNEGVPIALDNLWFSDHKFNRILNEDFSKGLDKWVPVQCDAVVGGQFANITKRENVLAGLTQDVSSLVSLDGKYQLACAVFNPSSRVMSGTIHLRIESSGDGVRFFSIPDSACDADSWTQLAGDVEPVWSGTLISATWLVNLSDPGDPKTSPDFSVFQPGVFDHTYPDGSYVMKDQLLSNRSNPYGSEIAQSLGVYVLDTKSQQVFIENFRLLGTLVLLNSHDVTIRKSVNMESYIYNYPVLMASENLTIELDGSVLDEAVVGFNFNPVEASFLGASDLSLDDSFVNRIDGLVYVKRQLTIGGVLRSNGVWLANEGVSILSANVNIRHRKLYFNEPPPGFVDYSDMTVAPGGFSRRTVQ